MGGGGGARLEHGQNSSRLGSATRATRLALEMDIGGWVSVNALLNRVKTICGLGRKVPMHVLLGGLWGAPQGVFMPAL